MITPKVRAAQKAAVTVHGLEGTKEYRAWLDIRHRCTNPKRPAYKDYGARGIKMCSRWLESPVWFLLDMGIAPSINHTVERVNNSGNYEPGNCVWATMRQQCRNRRSNVHVSAFGESRILIEWTEDPRCAVGYDVLRHRIVRYGWDAERAITTPVMTHSECGLCAH